MLSNKKLIFISLAGLTILGIFGFFMDSQQKSEVLLGGKTFFVEISDTNYLRSRGLSGHTPLADNQGMLFIFDTADLHGFWMKDMKFAIDIIWIDENLKISYIEKGALPETYPRIFYPEKPSLYVLEVNAGESEKLGLKVGDRVEFTQK